MRPLPPHTPRVAGQRPLPLLPLRLLVRFALAAVFIVTGGAKLASPDAFARTVSDFGLVPDGIVLTVAIAIASLEIAAGLLLWFDRRAGLPLVSGLLAVFTLVLAYGLWLGLDIDCGCLPFGTGHGLAAGLARNLVLLACCAYLFLAHRTAGRPSIANQT
jgi:hypothetical protein